MMQLLKKISIKIQFFFNHPKEGFFSERYIMILFYNKFFFLNITHVQHITHVHPKEGFFSEG